MNKFLNTNIVKPILFRMRNEKVFDALEDLERSQWLSPAEIRELQLEKLKSIINHAYKTNPFYHAIFDEHKLKPADIKSLEDLTLLPLLEKHDLYKLAATLKLPSRRLGHYSIRRTAGTSGAPVAVYVNNEANARSLAARYRAQKWYDLEIGEKEARFWGRSISSYGRILETAKDKLLNRLRIQPIDLNADRIEHTLEKIADFSPDFIYGYSSMISRFGEYLGSRNKPFSKLNLKIAICTAEMIMKHERERLSRIFDCPTIDEYGCSEVDIIAFECPSGSRHIMAENVLVEIVKKDDSQDDELVITDLNNHFMPLIRYRLGDLGTLGQEQCACGRGLPILKSIAGRSQNQYIVTEDGDLIHSVIFAYFFERLAEAGINVKQFRIIQKDLQNLLIQIALEDGDSGTLRTVDQRLETEITPLLGDKMRYQVKYFDAVEFSKIDHKFSYFESLLNN